MSEYLKKLTRRRDAARAQELKERLGDREKVAPGKAGEEENPAAGWKPTASARANAIAKRVSAGKATSLTQEAKQVSASPETVMRLVPTLNRLGAPAGLLLRMPRLRELDTALVRLEQTRQQVAETLVEPMKSRLDTAVPKLLLALEGALANVRAASEPEAVLAVVEKVLTDLPAVDEARFDAFVAITRAASRAESQDLSKSLKQSWDILKTLEPSQAVRTADAVERGAVLGADVSASLGVMVKALHAPETSSAALVDGVGEPWAPSQREALKAGVDKARAVWNNAAQTEAQQPVLKQGLSPDGQAFFDRAAKVLPAAELTTLTSVLALPGEVGQRVSRGEVALALLRDGAKAEQVLEVMGSVDRLGAFDATLAVRAAQIFPAQQLPGIYASVVAVLEQVPPATRALATRSDLQALTDAVAASRGAFANAAGPIGLLAPALAQAADARFVHNLLAAGPSIAQALHSAEGGDVKTALTASFAQDLKQLSDSGIDLAAMQTAYPHLPTELLPSLALAGLRRQNLEGALAAASPIFSAAGKKKDASRTLRNWVALMDASGADSTGLLLALKASPIKPADYLDVAKAMLAEAPPLVSVAQVQEATALLQEGKDPSLTIRERMRTALINKVGLRNLLQDANVKVTEAGHKAVMGPLANMFSLGAANAQAIPPHLLKALLVSALEDNTQNVRFTQAATQHQLKSLNPERLKQWKEPETMSHVRFQADGQKRFDARVTRAAHVGQLLLAKLEAQWGTLAELEQKHTAIVEKVRVLDKNDLVARREAVQELGDMPERLDALRKAKVLAGLTPSAMTPLRFEQLGDTLKSLGRFGDLDAATELRWLFRIDDLPYSEVTTNDGPSLIDIERLIVRGGTCVRWPSSDALAYMIDANKRIIMTKNQSGEERRAVLRLVERQDAGHEGQPMLVLERSYPDTQNVEEKLRLMEHALRRAAQMKIAVGFPTEYYWDVQKTQRRQIADMNTQLIELNQRYQTTSQEVTMTVVSPAGNSPIEYIDSAPPSLAHRGHVTARHYPGTQDNKITNTFMLLEPQ